MSDKDMRWWDGATRPERLLAAALRHIDAMGLTKPADQILLEMIADPDRCNIWAPDVEDARKLIAGAP